MSTKSNEIRKAQQAAWEMRERRRRILIWSLVALVGVLAVGALVYLVWQDTRPIPRTGVDVPIQGAEHIEVGTAHEPYSSNPPTSGPHYAQWSEAGFYEQAPLDENLVHSLEHGYVIISYDCARLTDGDCDGLKKQIRDAMSAGGTSQYTNTPKLIAVPRAGMESLLALTSWGHMDTFDQFDRGRILDYVRAFRDQAPEPYAP